jgi:hypothetical protein
MILPRSGVPWVRGVLNVMIVHLQVMEFWRGKPSDEQFVFGDHRIGHQLQSSIDLRIESTDRPPPFEPGQQLGCSELWKRLEHSLRKRDASSRTTSRRAGGASGW